jgi:hypothetical protein
MLLYNNMSRFRAEVNSYFHGPVDLGTGNSADYVVAHAERQHKRGRNPSVTYKDIKNPLIALEAAQADIATRVEDHSLVIDYTASNAGRVAVMNIWNEFQKVPATAYANARMENNLSVGAVFHVIEEGETAPYYHTTDNGTVELTYHFS